MTATSSSTRRAGAPLPKVALLFEPNNSYARTLLVGIGDYMLSHGAWEVHYVELQAGHCPPAWLARWEGDGVIVRGENRRIAQVVSRLRCAMVDLTPSRLLPHAPWVKTDDNAVAALAAQHFIERGFRSFGFCGDGRFSWAKRRGEEFRLAVERAGHPCAWHEPQSKVTDADAAIDRIGQWLRTLPSPTAVFACYDNRAQQVLEACRRIGRSVPEDIAVLGADNDEVLCALSPPPLSSVILNPRRVGWEAAALLAETMGGKKSTAEERLIPPLGVAVRQSTDVLSVADRKIASALRYIREHACEGIRVSDVVRHCPMARRALENRFQKLLGRTPRQEILRVQLNRAKELLVGTQLPVWEIAERVGFEPEYLSVVFRQQAGCTPREFRNKYGTGRCRLSDFGGGIVRRNRRRFVRQACPHDTSMWTEIRRCCCRATCAIGWAATIWFTSFWKRCRTYRSRITRVNGAAAALSIRRS